MQLEIIMKHLQVLKGNKNTGDSRYTRFRISVLLLQCYKKERQYPIRGQILKPITCVEHSPGLSGM
jgi:hypothetical protein